jgi:membrane-associated phospholipid phosphatase
MAGRPERRAPPGPNQFDSTRRYLRNGRDLGEWVHIDVLFQAYFNALLILFDLGAPFDPSNPYRNSHTQISFGTFGPPFMASILCAVAREALKAAWFQKWFVHRRLRPEAFAGRIHNHVTGAAHYPIHPDALNSTAVDAVFAVNGTYLLPMAFPEGSPTHPAYGAGHATVAGACVTVLKALFDESFVIPDPVEASADGLSHVPFVGPPLTLGGELNKLASNVALGRNIAGVHWRSDAAESLKLGEAVAIRYLRDERRTFHEGFGGFSLRKFDGTPIVV